jgi:VWFA-related protein
LKGAAGRIELRETLVMLGFAGGRWGWTGGIAILVTALVTGAGAQSAGPKNPKEESPNPTLTQRPVPQPRSSIEAEGEIKLDVLVEDAAGKPVAGLEPWDFKILDNGLVRKVVSFRRYDGVQVKPDPPVEVILVMDVLNLPFQQVAFVRGQIDEFLRQNGGQLKQPVSLILLTEEGIRVQPRPSTDGNAIASVVDGIKGHVSAINAAMGGEGYLERFQRSARAMDNIAQNEMKKPGRKLVVWVGPGWPMLDRPSDGYTETQQRRNFDGIVELSAALRQSRITVYSVAPAGASGGNPLHYQKFLKPVRTYHEAESGNMGLKVLVTQTGGRIMGPDNELAMQINRCIEDANAFYRISFDPALAEHADEYHELKIVVNKPGVTVRTNTGYYNEPATH